MKLFILGASASGKTSLANRLRETTKAQIVDIDDAILELNHGVWPDIETKNSFFLPKVIEQACRLPNVVLLNSYMPLRLLKRLRSTGFSIVLLEVSIEELKRRQALREKDEGWTNMRWVDWNEKAITDIKRSGFINRTISGKQDVDSIIREITNE